MPARGDARRDRHPAEPIDPDIDLRQEHPARPGRMRHPEVGAVFAVSLGGVVGTLLRYEAGLVWPTPPGSFPWTTFAVNAVGSALIGALLVVTTDVFRAHWLVRRALGTGLLGGFTTFAAYAVDSQRLLATGRSALALGSLLLTLLAALAAATASARITRRLFAARIAVHEQVATR